MVWIQVDARSSVRIAAPAERVFAFVNDVPRTGKLFPGIEQTEPLGGGLYRWRLAERRALAKSFRGEYVARYVGTGSRLSWTTVSGNMRSEGAWSVEQDDGQTRLSVHMRTELDAPVPALLRVPVSMFTQYESQRCSDTQLARIKDELEAEGRRLAGVGTSHAPVGTSLP